MNNLEQSTKTHIYTTLYSVCMSKCEEHNYETIQIAREDNFDVLLVRCTDCELSYFSKVKGTA